MAVNVISLRLPRLHEPYLHGMTTGMPHYSSAPLGWVKVSGWLMLRSDMEHMFLPSVKTYYEDLILSSGPKHLHIL